MNSTETETPTEMTPVHAHNSDPPQPLIYCSIAAAFGAIALVLIGVSIFVIRRKKKRRVVVVQPLPDLNDIEIHPSHPNHTPFPPLPEIPSPTGENTPTYIPIGKEKRSISYENVSPGSANVAPDFPDDDDINDHDYENNPVERQKYMEQLQPMKPKPDMLLDPARNKNLSLDPRRIVSSAANDRKQTATSQHGGVAVKGHTLGMKGYVNTNLSRSLEVLDKRVVPQPPPLDQQFPLMTRAMNRSPDPPPPKPHHGSTVGYVNMGRPQNF